MVGALGGVFVGAKQVTYSVHGTERIEAVAATLKEITDLNDVLVQ